MKRAQLQVCGHFRSGLAQPLIETQLDSGSECNAVSPRGAQLLSGRLVLHKH
jgi:hypothetical protein